MWSYDDLAIFIKVVEEGSFVKTAKRLQVPPSTISRSIARLEKSLETRLINRTPRAFRATEVGLKIFDQCMREITAIDQAIQRVTASSSETGGKLTITVPIFLSQELLNDWIIEFQLLHQEIEVVVHADNKMRDLIRDEVDVAIRIGPLDDSSLIAKKLWDIEIMVYGSQKYLSSHPEIHSPADIYNHSSLFYRGTQEKWMFQKEDSKDIQTIKPSARFHINDIRAIVHAVGSGLGLACLPKFAVDKCGANSDTENTIIPVLENYTVLPERGVYAVYHDRSLSTKNTRVFVEFMKEKFTQLQAN